jgi:hypothetical protein
MTLWAVPILVRPVWRFPVAAIPATSTDGPSGAGYEYAFTDNWIGRIEYRHADFGTASGALSPFFPTVIMPVRLSTDAVRVAVTYKFNSGFSH